MGVPGVLLVEPPVVTLSDVDPQQGHRAVPVVIKNLDERRSHSVRVRPPVTRRFAVRGALLTTQRLAPGMEAVLEVLFDARLAEPGTDHRDALTVLCDAGSVEVPLRALAARPRLRLEAAGGAAAGSPPGAAHPSLTTAGSRGAARDAAPTVVCPPAGAAVAAGLLEFGLVPVGSRQERKLRLVNGGPRPADWRAAVDGSSTSSNSIPLQVQPHSGQLAPGETVELVATLNGPDPGVLSGELLFFLAPEQKGTVQQGPVSAGVDQRGQQKQAAAEQQAARDAAKEPVLRCPVGASVVACGYQLVAAEDGADVKAGLEFGPAYRGESRWREVLLVNAAPSEARYDVSFGPASEMGHADAAGPAGDGSDDPHAAFLRLARIRAKAREAKDLAVHVAPLSGVVPAFGQARLLVSFHPPAAGRAAGFAAREPEPEEASRPFDYVVQVDVTGAAGPRALRFPVRGAGQLPRLLLEPRLLHFGGVHCGAWGDREVAITNGSAVLPLRVSVDRGGPYFQVDPPGLTLPPSGTTTVTVRYLPKALGNHRAAVAFKLLPALDAAAAASGDTPGESPGPLGEETVDAVGSCLQLGERRPLPGGPDATPETFARPKRPVDRSEAAIWTLRAAQGTLPGGYRRPKLWESQEGAKGLAAIGPNDPNGFTKDEQVERTRQADEYTKFIRAGRTAKARAHLTRLEGAEDDRDLGMARYRGLSPPKLHTPQGPEPLPLAPTPGTGGGPTFLPKAPPAAALEGAPTFQGWPQNDQERADCAAELAPADLAAVTVAPRVVDFGRVSTARPARAHLVVTNPLPRAIHVALDLSRVPELAGTAPLAQVVPRGAAAAFPLALRAHEVRRVREACQMVVNGTHFADFEVAAEVVPVTLKLSAGELEFAFGLDEWGSSVQRSLLVTNPHKATAEAVFKWTPVPPPAPPRAKGKGAAAAAGVAQSAAASGKAGSKKGSAGKAGTAAGAVVAAAAAGDAAATGDGEAGAGLVQSAAATLRLKGGADTPQKVSLVAELPGGCLRARDKEVQLGPVPVGEPQTAVVRLRNSGTGEAAFRAVPCAGLAVRPDRAQVPPEGSLEIQVGLTAATAGPWAATLELEIRGGKPLKIPIKAEGVLPSVHVQEPSLAFPATFIGGAARLPLTLVNDTPVPATLMCDLAALPEFELLLAREAWAGAYDSCPVQRIGPNGETTALGSKRVSRKMSSVDTQRLGAAARAGGTGCHFLIRLLPSSTLAMGLAFRPLRPCGHDFPLPLTLRAASAGPAAGGSGAASSGATATAAAAAAAESAVGVGSGISPLAVRVEAVGVQPQVVLSKAAVDFGACVVPRTGSRRPSPYTADIGVRNNTDAAVEMLLGAPSSEAEPGCLGVYAVEPSPGPFFLAPDEGVNVTLRFAPRDARAYEATVPLYVHGDTATPHLTLQLAGTGRLPRLTFEPSEVTLPPVPLGVRSWARFWVVNDGFDNLELRYRLPADQAHAPLQVELPEGNLIGLARERLPVVVAFSSARPISFVGSVEFLDESGRAFAQTVTGAADNSALTTRPFLEANAARLVWNSPPCGPPALVPNPDGGYKMPWRDALGPLQCPVGVSRYLSATTCKPWPLDLPTALAASRGKLLLDLIEALGGDAVTVKPVKAPGGTAAAGGGKPDPAQAALSVCTAALAQLKSRGAAVDAIAPELLLPQDDFERILKARHSAAAGDAAQEEALEAAWGEAEGRFPELAARAWTAVVTQAFRVYALARVTPQALRTLPGLEAAVAAAAAAAAAAAKQPTTRAASPSGAERARAATAGTQRGASALQSKSRQQQTAEDAAPRDTPAAAPGPGDLPSDEALSCSNVFSAAEACLLAWLNINLAKAVPLRAGTVTNLGADLSDGVALMAAVVAAWPPAASRLSLLRTLPGGPEDARANADLLVRLLRDLGLPYQLEAAEVSEAAGADDLLPLAAYLFNALPQLVLRGTVDFLCKLGEPQAREVELSNPSRKTLPYVARIEGPPDFALEGAAVRAEPGRTAKVSVRWTPTTAVPQEGLLVLQPRADGGAPASNLVFRLHGAVRTRAPLKRFEVSGPLYELATFEVHVVNPFPADCDFTVSVLHEPPEDDSPSPPTRPSGKKGSKAAAAAPGSSPASRKPQATGSGSKQQPDTAAGSAGCWPDPFGVDRPRLRLRAGAGEKLKGSFLPFSLGAKRAVLVLRDPDCGEFCYELAGEAGPPAPFMEHKATVSKDGAAQAVDIPVPFANPQLEAAKRTYVERHPLGRDKDQVARLKQELGRPDPAAAAVAAVAAAAPPPQQQQPPPSPPAAASRAQTAASGSRPGKTAGPQGAAGGRLVGVERIADYEVASSSTLVAPPAAAALVLHSGVEPAAGGKQGASGHKAGGGAGGGGGGAAAAQGASGGAVSLSAPPAPNVLRLLVRPVGTGLYPARITLTGQQDVRVIAVEVSAQSRGQTYSLELECPARQQVSQEVPIVSTADGGMLVQATVVTTGAPGAEKDKVPQVFSGPREVSVAPGSTTAYLLTFRPLLAGAYMGRLELAFPATGEKNVYVLTGRAGEPLSEGQLLVECQARCPVQRRLQVPNLLGSLPLVYSVLCDLDCLEGPETLACTSTRSLENYRLSVSPNRSGTFLGTISFMAPGGSYTWFSVEVRASPPPEAGTLSVSCPVRGAVAIAIPVVNPTDRPLVLRALYSSPALVGPARTMVPAWAGSGAEAAPLAGVFECYFVPLVEGESQGAVRLFGDEIGEFWWRIQMTATAPEAAEELPLLTAPLGASATAAVTITNPLASEAAFTVSVAPPLAAGVEGETGATQTTQQTEAGERFSVKPATFVLGPHASTELKVAYRPQGLGPEEDRATIEVASPTASTLTYTLRGRGVLPGSSSGGGTADGSGAAADLQAGGAAAVVELSAGVGEVAEQVLVWPNPLPSAATVRIVLEADSADAGSSAFSLGAPKVIPDATEAPTSRAQQKAMRGAAADTNNSPPLTVMVPPSGRLELAVRFRPAFLRDSKGSASIELVEPPLGAPGQPPAWRYLLKGAAKVDTRGVSFSLSCKARECVERTVDLPLPGLPPPPRPSGATPRSDRANAVPPSYSLELSFPPPSRDGAGESSSSGGAAGSAAGAAAAVVAAATQALSVELLTPQPDAGSEGGGGGATPRLRARLVFAPRRALAAEGRLEVVRSDGARWAYGLTLEAAAPDVDGTLTVEAHVGRTGALPLALYAPGDAPVPFTAEFTTESPLEFDVRPAKGLLPPAPAGAQGSAAGAAAAAPISVLYSCRGMRPVRGRLVVTAGGAQHVFDVVGRLPRYTPPDASKVRSTLDTGRPR